MVVRCPGPPRDSTLIWASSMITASRVLILTVCLTALVSLARAYDVPLSPDNTLGAPAPEHTRQWVRLSVLGPRSAPLLIVWVSPTAFPRTGFERLLLMRPNEYRRFVGFVRSYPCLEPDYANPEYRSLLVTQHSSRRDRVCTISRARACDFLSRSVTLRGVHWTRSKKEPLLDFALGIRCAR